MLHSYYEHLINVGKKAPVWNWVVHSRTGAILAKAKSRSARKTLHYAKRTNSVGSALCNKDWSTGYAYLEPRSDLLINTPQHWVLIMLIYLLMKRTFILA